MSWGDIFEAMLEAKKPAEPYSQIFDSHGCYLRYRPEGGVSASASMWMVPGSWNDDG